jgi:hypothetical protein
MAVWQFELAIVPAGGDSLVRNRGGFDIEPIDQHHFDSLGLFLEAGIGDPRPDHHGTNTYGDLDGNRIDLLTNGIDRREIWASIDARSDADLFCELLCLIAASLDCEFFAPEHGVRFAPMRKELSGALLSSRAWAYALDPRLFQASNDGSQRR